MITKMFRIKSTGETFMGTAPMPDAAGFESDTVTCVVTGQVYSTLDLSVVD